MKTAFFVSLMAALSIGAVAQAGLLHKTSFLENGVRYPAPDAMAATLQQFFPHGYANVGCTQLSYNGNRSALGDDDPAKGVPSSPQPSAAFSRWLLSCSIDLSEMEFEYLRSNSAGYSDVTSWVPENILKKCSGVFTGLKFAVLEDCALSNFNNDELTAWIQTLIETKIGPSDVIKDLGLAPGSKELAARLVKWSLDPKNRVALGSLIGYSDPKFALTPTLAVDKYAQAMAVVIATLDSYKY